MSNEAERLIKLEERMASLSEKTDFYFQDQGKKITAIFDMLNNTAIPSARDVLWIKKLLGGAWAMMVVLTGAVAKLVIDSINGN